jgi:hypothetical protein
MSACLSLLRSAPSVIGCGVVAIATMQATFSSASIARWTQRSSLPSKTAMWKRRLGLPKSGATAGTSSTDKGHGGEPGLVVASASAGR